MGKNLSRRGPPREMVDPTLRHSGKHTEEEGMVCEMVRFRSMDKVARNTRNADYMCETCGRGAIEASSLCSAVSI